MRRAVLLCALAGLLAAAGSHAQGVGGIAGYLLVGRSTVAAMPAASSVVRGLWIVTDASTSSTCATGGGSNFVVCVDVGASWSALVAGGGAATDLTCTDCVALGSETTGPYAASSSEAGAATTATALAANGGNCLAGSYALGVDASGAAESCTADDDVPEAGDFGALALTGDVTSSGLATTIAADSVALGTDTTGGYAASATEGGSATSVAANSVALGTDTTGGYAASSTEGGAASSVAANSVALGTDTTGGYAASSSEAGAASSVAANSVALTTDTTGNYAAGDAEAGAALTGDSATSFFSTGTIEPARLGSGSGGATKFLREDSTFQTITAGDFSGPASSTDNAFVRFDGTTGKLGQNGLVGGADTDALGTPAIALLADPDTGVSWLGGANTTSLVAGAKEALRVVTATNAVNYVNVTPSATTAGVTVGAAGTDTNIDLKVEPKGSGNVTTARSYISGGGGNGFWGGSISAPMFVLNTGGNGSLEFRPGGIVAWSNDSANASSTKDLSLVRVAANILGARNGSTGGAAISLVEQTAPAAPATNGAYLYAQDNGSGKTQICALFATGSAQCFVTEP
jgi:hypothetical protein